ncbi:hypothetical protein CRG98_026930 [Punica granatum]|uniref:Uncharacterized protein n=1 Tax=Punica granatum TaxID=22663 RepID=A0A2I0J9W4_PUNGR|nr:hypothetical protein CRG98_026930 [Punica granatum]
MPAGYGCLPRRRCPCPAGRDSLEPRQRPGRTEIGEGLAWVKAYGHLTTQNARRGSRLNFDSLTAMTENLRHLNMTCDPHLAAITLPASIAGHWTRLQATKKSGPDLVAPTLIEPPTRSMPSTDFGAGKSHRPHIGWPRSLEALRYLNRP